MHVHASDAQLSEGGSAKFFVKRDGDTLVQNRGKLNDRELDKIRSFIKQNYKEMYLKRAKYSEKGFCGDRVANELRLVNMAQIMRAIPQKVKGVNLIFYGIII